MIILDLYMPRLDGFEFLKKVKEHPEAKNIPIIVLTSSGKTTDVVEMLRKMNVGLEPLNKVLALAKELTVDELLNELISIQSKEWLTCSLCGVKVRATNMSSHMAKMHPR